MLDDLKKEFGQIRQAIGDGDEETAIGMLSLRFSPDDPLLDSLILLETRHSNLQQSIIEGVISRENENIERNGICKGLLHLVKALEARAEHRLEAPKLKPDLIIDGPTKQIPEAGSPNSSSKLDTRKMAIIGALLLAIPLVWGIGNWILTRGSEAPVKNDIKLRIDIIPDDLNIGALGKAQIELGNYTSEALVVPLDGVLLFKNTPVKPGKDSVKLRLLDLKFQHDIVRKSGDVHKGVLFHIILKTNTYRGKVLRPDLQPAPNIELEIENGLARTKTDSSGKFSFVLPDWGASTVRLVMRRAGKVILDKNLGLNPTVFKELKTPD